MVAHQQKEIMITAERVIVRKICVRFVCGMNSLEINYNLFLISHMLILSYEMEIFYLRVSVIKNPKVLDLKVDAGT